MRVVLEGKVVNVVDGDTIDIELSRTIRVRLLDCWAPETRTRDDETKRRGAAAKEYMLSIAGGRDVEVDIPLESDARFGDRMSFGRVLARVRRVDDGLDLSREMVSAGHATEERNP